jgi:hypothetical protein
MMERPAHELNDYEDHARLIAEDRWHWRYLRNVAIGFEFWPLEWHIGVNRRDDFAGGAITIELGPFAIVIHYNGYTGIFGRKLS